MDFEGVFYDNTDYELTKTCLGKGSFGKVYIVTNLNDNQKYAAKIINSVENFNGKSQMLFMRESSILSQLNHPSIVKFIGINLQSLEDPSSLEPTIITEYLPHGSLKDILDKEKNSMADLDWNATKKYICLIGIASAMKYLHHNGILHRDLKPENILMDDDYYPRVCDFGLSRCFPEFLTKSMQLSMTGHFGTPLYMSPELLMGEGHYGAGVDVYAFAFLAYEIVTGEEPYAKKGKKITAASLFKKIMSNERPEFNEFVTDKMKDLISKCWSQKPEDRPSFDEILDLLTADFSYFNEDVDEEEIVNFLDNIKEANEHEVKRETIAQMKEKIAKNQKIISHQEKIIDSYFEICKVLIQSSNNIQNIQVDDVLLLF